MPSGNKPLPEPMMTQIYVTICVIRPQWVPVKAVPNSTSGSPLQPDAGCTGRTSPPHLSVAPPAPGKQMKQEFKHGNRSYSRLAISQNFHLSDSQNLLFSIPDYIWFRRKICPNLLALLDSFTCPGPLGSGICQSLKLVWKKYQYTCVSYHS